MVRCTGPGRRRAVGAGVARPAYLAVALEGTRR